MEITYSKGWGDRPTRLDESHPIQMDASDPCNVTWWPTNEWYMEMEADEHEREYTSCTLSRVTKVSVSGKTITLMAAGRARIMFTENIKGILLCPGGLRPDFEELSRLDVQYNNYGPGGSPL